ncbi:unnamed protein product [Natator depressus]
MKGTLDVVKKFATTPPQNPSLHQPRIPAENCSMERHITHYVCKPSTELALSDPIYQANIKCNHREGFPYLSGQLPSRTSLEQLGTMGDVVSGEMRKSFHGTLV